MLVCSYMSDGYPRLGGGGKSGHYPGYTGIEIAVNGRLPPTKACAMVGGTRQCHRDNTAPAKRG